MDEKKFTKDFIELNKSLLKRLMAAQTTDEAREVLDMVEGLASQENSLAISKTIYGLAYLIENKPWYDFQKGFEAVKEAAESDNPFGWFILGSLYLNGKPGLPKDPVLAKYWIEKAADNGHKDALLVRELQWGNNSEGFEGWLAGQLEKESNLRKRIVMGAIVLVLIAIIILLVRY